MTDHIEIPDGSPTDAVERFAKLWWDGDQGSAEVDAPPAPWPAGRASTLVIRAERV